MRRCAKTESCSRINDGLAASCLAVAGSGVLHGQATTVRVPHLLLVLGVGELARLTPAEAHRPLLKATTARLPIRIDSLLGLLLGDLAIAFCSCRTLVCLS